MNWEGPNFGNSLDALGPPKTSRNQSLRSGHRGTAPLQLLRRPCPSPLSKLPPGTGSAPFLGAPWCVLETWVGGGIPESWVTPQSQAELCPQG